MFISCVDRVTIARAATLAGALLLAAAARAYDIPVVNGSFEDPPLADSHWSQVFGPPPVGWVVSGGCCISGHQNLADDGSMGFAGGFTPDGEHCAFSNGGFFLQTVAANLEPNRVYTLTIQIGHRSNLPFQPYIVELRAGGTTLVSGSSVVPPLGAWAPLSLTYATMGSEPEIGQPLSIYFWAQDDQVNFDDVRLTGEFADPDEDGFMGTADCDETDACVHAGAVDLPGDGIDQDCDGADPCPCDGFRNRGGYVACVAKRAGALADAGLISVAEMDCIVSTAAGSDCGRDAGASSPGYSDCFGGGCP